MSTPTHTLHVTFFASAAATTLSTEKVSLPELREKILTTTKDAKAKLPWLKLATFGDQRSDGKSLPHDKNVRTLSGIETDYDAEQIPFDDAVAIVKDVELYALLYTSPSHSVEKPRWRVLCPTSRELEPAERAQMVARLNGLFGGVFSGESFALSQAYYYGSVNNNPAHRAEITGGDFIDLRDDLDAGAIHKKSSNGKARNEDGEKESEAGKARTQQQAQDDADKLEWAIRTGGNLPEGKRSELVWWVINELLRHGYRATYIEKVLIDRRTGISAHIYDQSNPSAYAKRQVKKAIAEIDFARGEKNMPYITPSNICIALLKLRVTITYDSFADRTLIDGLKDFGPALDDGAVTRIWLQFDRRFHFRPAKHLLFDVIKDAAKLNSFHPVCDYLNGLTWDGVKRLDTWLSDYAGAENTPYTQAVGKLMLVAAVRRVRQPGCKFDEMVVLESEQGKEKSIGLETMAVRKDWYSDDLPLNAESRRVIESTRGRWIIEAAELAGMRHADVEHLKAFLSRTVDRARMSYDRINTEYLRQCVVVGTTNAGTYLRDTTGNRRYWPIRIEQFDLVALVHDRDQLWAEAAACEAAGESIRLDPALYAAAAEEQTQREVDEPWVDALRSALVEVLPDGTKIEMQGKIAAQSIWAILDLKEGARAQTHNHRMGEAMRKLGWKRPKSGGVVRIESKVVSGYVKGEPPWRTIKAERTFDRDTGYNLNVWYIDDKDDAAPGNADDEPF